MDTKYYMQSALNYVIMVNTAGAFKRSPEERAAGHVVNALYAYEAQYAVVDSGDVLAACTPGPAATGTPERLAVMSMEYGALAAYLTAGVR